MRRVARGLLVIFFMMFTAISAMAADYKVLVIPDNIANPPVLDSFIYEESAEFFATQIINTLNMSGTIESPTVSEVRQKLQRSPRLVASTKSSLLRFKKSYNVDFVNAKKLAMMYNTNKILLITTSADAQNYFMRRTFWDFLDVPGASVIDPAIKLSTYAVLIDTDRNIELWSDTFYKTISSCENRMVANTMTPATIQLEKVKDYSRMLAPEIAQSVQVKVVPKTMLTKENTILYGPKDFYNVFTKKYRWYRKGSKIMWNDGQDKYHNHIERDRSRGIEPLEDKFRRWKRENKAWRQARKEARLQRKYDKQQQKLLKQKREQEEKDFKQSRKIQNITDKHEQFEPSKDSNVIEINSTTVQKEVKPQEDTKQEEAPKMINVTKEEQIDSIDSDYSPKYYPTRNKMRSQGKNTTINDI